MSNAVTATRSPQLHSVSAVAGRTPFGYNSDGLMSSRTDAVGTTSYRYDTAGHSPLRRTAAVGVASGVISVIGVAMVNSADQI